MTARAGCVLGMLLHAGSVCVLCHTALCHSVVVVVVVVQSCYGASAVRGTCVTAVLLQCAIHQSGVKLAEAVISLVRPCDGFDRVCSSNSLLHLTAS
jgi:hypothetical protein